MKKFILLALLSSLALADHDEVIPAGEEAATAAVMKLIEAQLRAEKAAGGTVHRDAHAKAHGCVKAQFEVLPHLPMDVSVGLFAKGATYEAWLRFSNGSGQSQKDSDGDGRGLAIKVLGVPGEKLLEDEKNAETQDFLMINHPVFFVRNALDYVDFQKAVAKGNPLAFFFPKPGLSPRSWQLPRLHELGIANAIRKKKVTNLLSTSYWSMTPFALGTREMKYEARPCEGRSYAANSREGENFLRDNLVADLAGGDACFAFFVQVRNEPAKQPIEDATLEWKGGEYTQVAEVRIPKQAFNTAQQLRFCENLSYTPWHSLPEHQPLGGINRVRKTVYREVSKLRHQLNNEARKEP